MCPGHWRLGVSNSAHSKRQVSLCSASFFSLFFSNPFSVSHFPFLSNPDFNFLCHNDDSQCKALILAPFVTGDSQSGGVVSVSYLAKLDQISKQCAYRDRQVSSLGRVSLTCTGFNLNQMSKRTTCTSYHQLKPSRQVVGLDRLLEHIW